MKSGPFELEQSELSVGNATGAMVQARLRVLGRFSLELEHVTAPCLATQKARAVLAYLVAHRNCDVARERLLEIFWPQAEPAAAKDGLRSALWSIRRSVKNSGCDPNDYVVANRTIVRWTAVTWYDAEAFLEFARSDDPSDLEAAFTVYQGDFLEGDYEEWTVSERARLGDEYESVLARLVGIGQSREAAQLLIERNPYDEASYLLLIQSELSSGRIVAAAALADRCQKALVEVDALPSPALQQLLGRIWKRQIEPVIKPSLPFVGRADELSTVRHYLQTPLAGRILLLSGEAGIGKSTFLSRLVSLGSDDGIRAVIVQCFDTDSRLFGPFEELYAELYGEPFNPLVSNRLPPAERLAEALFDALDPSVVLCIDDAHTLTSEPWLVLCALARRAHATQHSLIISTRTEGVRNISAAVNGCSYETVVLGPLQFNDLRSGIDSLISGDNGRVARTLFERSGGHPLFAVTLLDSLAQSGILRSELGMWCLAGTLDEQISLPKTLKTYIEARLCSRGDVASTVASALSLEPAATADDLAAVLDLPDENLFRAFDDLLSIGVLVQIESAPQIAFAHELYREVATKTLNPGRRARFHRAFGERFLRSSAADSALKCARHLALSGDPMRAAAAFYRAALEALESHAPLEARDRCITGIAGLETLERSSDVESMLARLKILLVKADAALGDSHAAKAGANEAIALAERVGDSDIVIRASLALQSIIRDEYDAVSAMVSARAIESMATVARDEPSLAIALADKSWAHRLLGSERDSANCARESERIASATEQVDIMCYALEQAIFSALTWWRFDEAVDIASRAPMIMLRASRLARSTLEAALAALNFAIGDVRNAESALSAGFAIFHEDGREPSQVRARELFSRTRVRLTLAATSAQIALAEGDFQRALNDARELGKLPSRRALQLAALFRADAQFELGTIVTSLDDGIFDEAAPVFLQDVLSGSRSPAIAQALRAVTTGAADAQQRVFEALDRIEAAGRRSPLQADRAFAQLARAAETCGAHRVAVRAGLRRADYGAARDLASSRIKRSDRLVSKNA